MLCTPAAIGWLLLALTRVAALGLAPPTLLSRVRVPRGTWRRRRARHGG